MEVSFFAVILMIARMLFPPGVPFDPAGKPAEMLKGKALHTRTSPSLNVRERPDPKTKLVTVTPAKSGAGPWCDRQALSSVLMHDCRNGKGRVSE